jgi:hypothetical protein
MINVHEILFGKFVREREIVIGAGWIILEGDLSV